MREELLEKIRRLEEERQTADLCSTGADWGKRKRRRQVFDAKYYYELFAKIIEVASFLL